MLHAIISGKANRGIRWKDLFCVREDLLTAVFFGRLPYLSDEAQASVLEILIEGHSAPGSIEEVIFWPKMHYTKNGELRWVEPDVLIKCQKATIIIEIKPPPELELKSPGQKPQQWKKQLDALSHELHDDESRKPVIFVALGLTEHVKDYASSLESNSKYPFELKPVTLEWRTLYEEILLLEPSLKLKSDCAVVDDWRKALDLFGLSRPPFNLESLIDLVEKFKANDALASLAAWVESLRSPFDRLADFAKTKNFKGDFKWL